MHGQVKVIKSDEQKKLEKAKKIEEIKKYSLQSKEILSIDKNANEVEKILKLTEEILMKYPSSYVFWNLRREMLLLAFEDSDCDQDSLLKKELILTHRCLYEDPKAYSTWHHRVWTMMTFNEPNWDAEIKLCDEALEIDERNFHCWDYRRFVASYRKSSSQAELDYTDELLTKNFSNFSAWQYRSELLKEKLSVSTPDQTKAGLHSILKEELELVNNAIFTDPKDQSPWFYLWWILGHGCHTLTCRELFIMRKVGRVYFTFTSPVMRKDLDDVHIELAHKSKTNTDWITENISGASSWQSYSDEPSCVWFICLDSLPDLEGKSLKVEFNSKNQKLCLQAGSNETEKMLYADIKCHQYLNPLVSPNIDSDAVGEQLQLVEELLDMEPDNKWALLTCINLTAYINPQSGSDKIKSYIEKLIVIDYQRQKYYEDLRSRYQLNVCIASALKKSTRSMHAMKLYLTQLSGLNWCSTITLLDLSDNRLKILPDTIVSLVCLEELNLDKNSIISLNGIDKLKSLKKLSAVNNKLSTFNSIQAVLYSSSLSALSLSGNPVLQTTNFVEQLSNLSQLEKINTCMKSIFTDLSC